jgi:hypothetical protein
MLMFTVEWWLVSKSSELRPSVCLFGLSWVWNPVFPDIFSGLAPLESPIRSINDPSSPKLPRKMLWPFLEVLPAELRSWLPFLGVSQTYGRFCLSVGPAESNLSEFSLPWPL